MPNNRAVIPSYQLFTLMAMTQLGIKGLTVPFTVFLVAKSDGWISIILAGLFIQLNIMLLWYICKSFPNLTLYEISKVLFGKYVGNLLNAMYIIFFVATAITSLLIFVKLLKSWILQYTPHWVIVTLFVLICMYLVMGGIESISRFYTLLFPLTFLLTLFVAIAHKNAHYLYIFPIGNEGLLSTFMGVKEGVYAMTGFELLFVIFPFFKGTSKDKLKMMSFSNILVTSIYTFITFTSIVYFSPQEFLLVPEPILYMIKEFTFIMVERIDLFFLSFLILYVGATYSSYLYVASIGLTRIINKGKMKMSIWVIGIITIVFVSIPRSSSELESWVSLFINITFLFIFVLPLLYLILTFWKKGKHGG